MMMKRRGFTLVEIMIVVAIIGLLVGIAVPNLFKARETAEKNACIANLKQIQKAVEIWAIDTNQAVDAQPAQGDLVLGYLRKWPTCRGVAYAVPAVNADPVCPGATTGHNLSGTTGRTGRPPPYSG